MTAQILQEELVKEIVVIPKNNPYFLYRKNL